MQWDETEISGFLDETDTAEIVFYYPLFGNPDLRDAYENGREAILNFQEPFFPVDLNAGAFEQASPSAVVRPSDVPELMNGDIFIIRSAEYSVVSAEPDGAGLIHIKLSRL
jgi:hypothetical protein